MSYDLNVIDLKKCFQDKEYLKSNHLLMKDYGAFYNFKYDKKLLNYNNIETLGLYRSIVCNMDGKVVCFSPPKSFNYEYFNQDTSGVYIEEFVEGTMINMFWNSVNDDWEITTRTTLGAKCKFQVYGKNTFRYMFLNAMNNMKIDFNDFDKNYCYSFVLQHPENKIVIPVKEARIVLVDIFICKDNVVTQYPRSMFHEKLDLVIKNSDRIVKPKGPYPLPLNDKSLSENLKVLVNNQPYTVMGYYVHGKDGKRTKIRNSEYEYVKHLKGNSPKIQYQYYNLRQLNKVKEFLEFFPEYKKTFSDLRYDLHRYTQKLYSYYNDCYINKLKPLKTFPYEYKTHLYHLHSIYLNDLKNEGKYVNFDVVKNYVNNLEPPRLMHVINYPLHRQCIDDKVIKNDFSK